MYIGIDYGTKRVGVALSDDEGRVAFPREVVAEKEALAYVARLTQERKVRGIVVGESKDFAGHDNPLALRARSFADELERVNGVPVIFEPEFLTSAQAARFTSNESLDASAAALILQSFLDRKNNTASPQEKSATAPVDTDEEERTPIIDIDTFHRVDIRVGEIVLAEKVEKADKLLKLSVVFGNGEVRQIVSGIAAYFSEPAVLVGKRVAFVYNLKPRMIRGLESNGMILAALGDDGGFDLCELDVPPGTRIG